MYEIVMAVDGEEERLNRQIDAIQDLPGIDELSVIVLYVHEEVDTPADEAGKQIIDAINEDLADLQGLPGTVAQARDRLEELGIDANVSELTGDPPTVILDVAAEVDANAICVAGRDRNPIGKAVFGSVTQKVLLQSDRPVIVAR